MSGGKGLGVGILVEDTDPCTDEGNADGWDWQPYVPEDHAVGGSRYNEFCVEDPHACNCCDAEDSSNIRHWHLRHLARTDAGAGRQRALDAARAKHVERESRLAAFAAGTVTFDPVVVCDLGDPYGTYESDGQLQNGRPKDTRREGDGDGASTLYFDDSHKWYVDDGERWMRSACGSSALLPQEVAEWEHDDGNYASYCLARGGGGELSVTIAEEELDDDEGAAAAAAAEPAAGE